MKINFECHRKLTVGYDVIRAKLWDTKASKILWVSLFSLIALVRGLHLQVQDYPLAAYLFSYQKGFLLRAFMGELMYLWQGESLQAILPWVNQIALIQTLVFFMAMVTFLFRLVDQAPEKTLLILFFLAGPSATGLLSMEGFFDQLSMISLVWMWWAWCRNRYWLVGIIYVVASCIHEMVAIWIWPLLWAETWQKSPNQSPYRPDKRQMIWLIGLALTTGLLLYVGQASQEQINWFSIRLHQLIEQKPIKISLYKVWMMPFASHHLLLPIATVLFYFTLLHTYLYLVFYIIWLVVMTHVWQKSAEQKWLCILFFASSELVIFLGFDSDRFLIEGMVPLALFAWYHLPVDFFKSRRTVSWLLLGLVIEFFCHYPLVDRYGRESFRLMMGI